MKNRGSNTGVGEVEEREIESLERVMEWKRVIGRDVEDYGMLVFVV